MRIKTRLLLLAAVTALLVCCTSYLVVSTARHARETQRRTLADTVPAIELLQSAKFNGLRAVRLSTEYGFLRSLNADETTLADEADQLSEATRDLDTDIERLRTVWARTGADPGDLQTIVDAAAHIKALDGRFISSEARSKRTGHDEARVAGSMFISALDRMILDQRHRRQTQSEDVIAAGSRAIGVGLAGLIGCAVFILLGALAMGQSIARRVRVLQRAAVNIGRGDWDTTAPWHTTSLASSPGASTIWPPI